MRNQVWIFGLMLGLAGCQCCRFTERYQDAVDCIADHEGHLDRWYHPEWDVSRIGQPDWCQGRFNHWLYGDACRCCRRPPDYDHAAIYIADSERVAPSGTVPAPSIVPPAIPPQSNPAVIPTEVPPMIQEIPDPPQIEEGADLLPFPPPPPLPDAQSSIIPFSIQDDMVTPAGFEWADSIPSPASSAPAPVPAPGASSEPDWEAGEWRNADAEEH